MKKILFCGTLMVLAAVAITAVAQARKFSPVTSAMLLNPPPDDWLMFSRTYDAQRYSPLNQITKQNAGRLTQVWSNALPAGTIENIPIVHDCGVDGERAAQESGRGRTAA